MFSPDIAILRSHKLCIHMRMLTGTFALARKIFLRIIAPFQEIDSSWSVEICRRDLFKACFQAPTNLSS